MTAHAQCVAPDNTLVEAAGLMRELDVGALPVCEDERVAGMVTDRDIVLRGVADGRDANTATVRDVMSPGIIHVFADQSVEDAVRVMEEKQVRRLPVLDRSKRLVGIVSLGDIAICSNPAFSGIALKEVSLSPEQRMSDRSSRMLVRQDRAPAPRGTKSTGRSAVRRKKASASSTRRRTSTQTRAAGRSAAGTGRKRGASARSRRGR